MSCGIKSMPSSCHCMSRISPPSSFVDGGESKNGEKKEAMNKSQRRNARNSNSRLVMVSSDQDFGFTFTFSETVDEFVIEEFPGLHVVTEFITKRFSICCCICCSIPEWCHLPLFQCYP